MLANVHVIIIISGKRKSGKDYIASALHDKLGADQCSILRLSGPLKKQYAEEHNLDNERLLDASEYKETYRADMIRWGEERRQRDPGYFCRIIASGPGSERPAWIISDARRRTDLEYFLENYGSKVLAVRVTADEIIRQKRGWMFTPGVDDAPSECDLDTVTTFDVTIDNSVAAKQPLQEQLDALVNKISARLKNV